MGNILLFSVTLTLCLSDFLSLCLCLSQYIYINIKFTIIEIEKNELNNITVRIRQTNINA